MATETFNSGSGTWFVPTGQELTQIELWGAGGGGAAGEVGSGDGTRGGGGGGGGYCKHVFGTPVPANTPISYSVGASGAGGRVTESGDNGGAGGASTVSTYGLTANGGAGGTSPSSTNAGGAGGTASGGNTTNTTGTAGRNGEDNGGNGFGGAGANGGAGGSSDGAAGTAPGGGGASCDETSPGASGAGAAGRITFTYQAASAPPGNPLVIGIVIGDGNPSVPATGNIWLLRPPSAYRRFETRTGKPVLPLQASYRVRRGRGSPARTTAGQAGSINRRGEILVSSVVHPNGHGAGRCRGWGPCFRGSDTRR